MSSRFRAPCEVPRHASLNPMLSRRSLLQGGIALAVGVAVTRRAGASVMRALTLSELVNISQHAFVGTPTDAFSQWDTIGKQRRIVTYTMVDVHSSIDGRPTPTASVMLRTLGGISGNIGQVVPGEAMLRTGETAAMFVTTLSQDLYGVTGMSQGHYPLTTDGSRRLHAITNGLEMQAGPDAAVHRLDGRTVSEVESLVFQELTRGTH